MNYHLIKKDDMLNGDGLRVTLFCSGCEHKCPSCHNPETWSVKSGKKFDDKTQKELFELLKEPYISGITFSGGDPLNDNNVSMICKLIQTIRSTFGKTKNIWLYTGYTFEDILAKARSGSEIDIKRTCILSMSDVLVDGKFIESLQDINYPWAGSTNQRVIDVRKTLKNDRIVLYKG